MQTQTSSRGVRSLLRRINPHDLSLFAKALMTVARVRLMLTFRQTETLRSGIARDYSAARASQIPDAATEYRACAEVAWSVTAMARLVPGATCLTQAFSAQTRLARRGIASSVHVTMTGSEHDGLNPHAWLVVNGVLLLGGTSQEYAAHRWLVDYNADGNVQKSGFAPTRQGGPA